MTPEKKKEFLKYGIITIILLLIILGIIWYRNYQKNKAATAAKQGLQTSSNPITGIFSPIGKGVYTKKDSVNFYYYNKNAGILSLAYTKTNVGEWSGDITGTKSPYGDTNYYEVVNSSGNTVYVLKTDVTVK